MALDKYNQSYIKLNNLWASGGIGRRVGLAERGVLPKIISKLMGHSCVETAQKYYIQATDKRFEL